MTPRADMVTVTEHTTALAVERLSRSTGRSRFPVTDLKGGFTGQVHIREVVRATAAGTDPVVRELMTTPVTLPADQPVARAVTVMRQERAQLALVADATGQVVGIAALEDLLEELIGDFDDETDNTVTTAPRAGPDRAGGAAARHRTSALGKNSRT